MAICAPYIKALERLKLGQKTGRLTSVHSGIVEASGCEVLHGELVEIRQAKGNAKILAEVVGMKDEAILLMPYGTPAGLCLNSQVIPLNRPLSINVSDDILGRVIDPLGNFLDSDEHISQPESRSCYAKPINPLSREPISKVIGTGVKAIDIFCPLGQGQRIGIMAGSGVGKSTLLAMIAANTDAEIVVISLIGERGREVGDFINDTLGKQGQTKAVIVAAAAEQPALLRRQAAFTATTIAEWFRDKGKNVLLIMDSITRFAMAQREIGLSTGEPIGTRGYPSSVFSLLPPLIERAGNIQNSGSITAIYTVLVEGDDMNEPVTDHMRSLLDGHITLSRELAAKSHYPAIDILNTLSRLQGKLLNEEQMSLTESLRKMISSYSDARDIIELGAYEPGRSREIDLAVKIKPDIDNFLQQAPSRKIDSPEAWRLGSQIKQKYDGMERSFNGSH